MLAKAVIDASGTYRVPNPLGANGHHAIGERGLAARIFYGMPDVLDAARRYAGRRILVVGSGHSAMNVLLDLERLASRNPPRASCGRCAVPASMVSSAAAIAINCPNVAVSARDSGNS